ncbi:hypothetical protein PA7559_17880 [Pseudoalteromonas distincta]
MFNQYERLNLTLTALKISDMKQFNNEKLALLSTQLSYLKIEHLIKLMDISILEILIKFMSIK